MKEATFPHPSLHELSVQNPWFAVHPLRWTARHLELLHCTFQQIDAPLKCKTGVHQEDTVDDVSNLLTDNSFLQLMRFSRLLTNPGSPFRFEIENAPVFQFGTREITRSTCDVLVPLMASSLPSIIPTAPRVVGVSPYRYTTNARKERFEVTWGTEEISNEPVRRKLERIHRLCTPKIWNEDPYLICLMLSLAQHMWRSFDSASYPVHLITCNSEDTVNTHIFSATFPVGIMDQLGHPLSTTKDTWPTIYHTKIPFEPYGTFHSRIMTFLTLSEEYETGCDGVESEPTTHVTSGSTCYAKKEGSSTRKLRFLKEHISGSRCNIL